MMYIIWDFLGEHGTDTRIYSYSILLDVVMKSCESKINDIVSVLCIT